MACVEFLRRWGWIVTIEVRRGSGEPIVSHREEPLADKAAGEPPLRMWDEVNRSLVINCPPLARWLVYDWDRPLDIMVSGVGPISLEIYHTNRIGLRIRDVSGSLFDDQVALDPAEQVVVDVGGGL